MKQRSGTVNKREILLEMGLFLMFLLIPILMYLQYIVKKEIPVGTDAIGFYRIRELLSIAIKDGEIPLWNKYIMNGTPYVGEGAGFFNPITWLCAFLPSYIQVYALYIIHMAIGAYFMYRYLKEINISILVSVITAILYETSVWLNGFRKGHIMIIIVIIWLPAILFFIEKYVHTKKYSYLFLSSLCMAFSFYEFFPQAQLYIDAAVFFYLLYAQWKEKFSLKKIIKDTIMWLFSFIGLIAVQLLPTVEQMRTYASQGAESMTYEEFTAYSMHPVKLLMLVFPRIFDGNITQAMGFNNSSEMDIEIYMGIMVIIVFLLGLNNCYKNRHYWFSLCAGVGALLYAAVGHIPWVGKLVYMLPVFGSMRCPARATFLFSFFVLVGFACVMNEIVTSTRLHDFTLKIQKILKKAVFACVIILAAVMMVTNDMEHTLSEYIDVFLPFIIILAISYVVVVLIEKKISAQIQGRVLALFMMIVILVDVMPYSLMSTVSKETDIFNDTELVYYDYISDHIVNGKTIVAQAGISGENRSLLANELGIHYGIPCINCFVAFNNSDLYSLMSPDGNVGKRKNFSGLFTGFEEIQTDIAFRNDLLSMIGVKYIIDPDHVVPDEGNIIVSLEEDEPLYEQTDYEIAKMDPYNSMVYNVELQDNAYYLCRLSIENESSQPVDVFFDFYGGENYDNAEQQKNIRLESGVNDIEFVLNSGDVPEDVDVYARLITMNTESDLYVKSIQLSSMSVQMENAYAIVIEDGTERIIENLNARDILWVPDRVEGVASFDDLYENQQNYDLDNISYIVSDYTVEVEQGIITNIDWKNNSITANVSFDNSDGFVNFANNYYPGWNAYIDGKKTDLYKVNGLIQGIVVPRGSHSIRFVYQPTVLYLGIGITLITIILNIAYCIYKKRQKKN